MSVHIIGEVGGSGWHLITADRISRLDQYLSDSAPPRVFAGVKTYYYIFESEEQALELIGVDEEGNFAPEYASEVVVPEEVTMRQAKLALLKMGLLDAVDQAIAGIEDEQQRKLIEIEWEYAREIRRDWPAIQIVAAGMGLTAAQVDDLFVLAGNI